MYKLYVMYVLENGPLMIVFFFLDLQKVNLLKYTVGWAFNTKKIELGDQHFILFDKIINNLSSNIL